MSGSTYAVWGWGEAADEPTPAAVEALAPLLPGMLGFAAGPAETPARLGELPAERVSRVLPAPLRGLASIEPLDRARHGVSRSYRDVLRGIRGRPDVVPDAVLRPGSEAEVAAVLDWAATATWRCCPSAAEPAWSAGSSRSSGTDGREWSASTWADCPGSSPSTRSPVPCRCAPAPPDPPWRRPCGRTASPCASTPSPSSARPSAAGWRHGRAVTSRRVPPTSTTSSSRCGP